MADEATIVESSNGREVVSRNVASGFNPAHRSRVHRKRPECHPDRKHYGHGLCNQCYNQVPERQAFKNRQAREEYWPKIKGTAKNNARYLRANFKMRLGITLEQRDAILAQNNGLCLICSENVATNIDHCHATGVIRGGLCQRCNLAIGHFKDRIDLLKSAIAYLKKGK